MKILKFIAPLMLLAGITAFGQANKPTATISTITGLVARIPVTVPRDEVVSVLGYTAEGDWGAPRVAKYVSGSSAATNLGCVFMPVTGTGRWVFQDCESGEVDIRWFGGTNTSTAITAGLTKLLSRPTTINGANRSIYLADGVAPTAAAGTLALYATNLSSWHELGIAHGGGSNDLVATRSTTTGAIWTNQLPGILSSLSVGNRAGVTNVISVIVVTNPSSSQITSNISVPSWSRGLLLEVLGGGGGGGSGGRYAAGAVSSGGGGGGGGAYHWRWIDPTYLWTNVLVITLGGVGAGGDGPTTDTTAGTNGSSGGVAYISVGATGTTTNILVRAAGGSGGVGGDGDGSSGGAAGTIGGIAGTAGGPSSASGAAGTAGTSAVTKGGFGGGAGGGVSTADAPAAGGAGRNTGSYGPATATSGGAVNGAVVQTYASLALTVPYIDLSANGSAAGSGGATNTVSAAGADGEFPGVGGGGSGGTRNGYTPGRGGHGGWAAARITIF